MNWSVKWYWTIWCIGWYRPMHNWREVKLFIGPAVITVWK